jgi:hypothetical protein
VETETDRLFSNVNLFFTHSSGSSGTHQAVAGNEGQGLQISASGIERGKFYYALYEFAASEPTMLHLFRGQVNKWNYNF